MNGSRTTTDRQHDPLTLDSRQAATLLGISERHLRDLAREGRVARVRLGRRTLYTMDSLRALVDAHTDRAEN